MLINELFLSEGQVSAIISVIGVLIGAIISLTIYMLSGRKGRKDSLVSRFNQTYKNAFSIKEKIEKQLLPEVDKKFYFELDYILNTEDIQEEILDYITEVENYFSTVLGKFKLDNSFKKLSSFALYSRWCSLYGFVIKMRKGIKSKKMFASFINVVNKMEKMDKVKSRIAFPKAIYYVGIRNSDGAANRYERKPINMFCKTSFFKGSIAMFPGKGANFPVRPNQNMNGKIFLPYIENKMKQIISCYSKGQPKVAPRFMFYNPAMVYKLSDSLRDYVMCLNEQMLLNKINNKILCRTWLLNSGIDIVAFKTMTGQEICERSYTEICDSPGCVIQSNYGGGGIGTFLINEKNYNDLKSRLNPLGQYIVSPYIDNSISVNTHVFISDKQTVLSPASVQIIENVSDQLCYRGADFIAFKSIDGVIKDKIRDISIKIAGLLREIDYRGVAGIDFIISKDGRVYCSEINPRFQASSILLDLYLAKNKKNGLASSVFELNVQAFNNALKSDLCFDDDVGFSCHYYYDDNKPIEYFADKAALLKKTAFRVDMDEVTFDANLVNQDSYLFRAVFDHQICAISPEHTLWINDNILVENKPDEVFRLKIALMNQGVRLANVPCDVKQGVYQSVDISLSFPLSKKYNEKTAVDVNCVTEINLAKYSPFVLDCQSNQLLYYGNPIGNFKLERELSSDISELNRKILYKATDRIRIKMIGGCEFKNYGMGCEFCDVPFSEEKFSLNQIISALKQLKESGTEFRHILIGGGTCLHQNIWEDIINLTKWLKADEYFKNKPISLMSILPPAGKNKESILYRLKEAGIEEVAFNLEVSDEKLAEKLMPGKYKGKEVFYKTMTDAVSVFGVNSVRSALIVGLDKKENIVSEVRRMAENGIIPCLSALRALRKASANLKIHPTNEYLIDVYYRCKEAITKFPNPVKKLGPPCERCRNNMLIE